MKNTENVYPANLLLNALSSAENIVPLLIKLFNPQSIIDVGCGLGTWLSVFQQKQVNDILGVDNPANHDLRMLVIPQENFLAHDLTQPLKLDQRFDLTLCLEVAEHLPMMYAPQLIKSLTQLSNIIVFSAAIPYQGGIHHVNEQWPTYWIQLFEAEGFVVLDCIRNHIWNNEEIEYWYRQNLFVFIKEEVLMAQNSLRLLKEKYQSIPSSLVHPYLWDRAIHHKDEQIANLNKHIDYLKQENSGIRNAFKNLVLGIKRKLFFWQTKQGDH